MMMTMALPTKMVCGDNHDASNLASLKVKLSVRIDSKGRETQCRSKSRGDREDILERDRWR